MIDTTGKLRKRSEFFYMLDFQGIVHSQTNGFTI